MEYFIAGVVIAAFATFVVIKVRAKKAKGGSTGGGSAPGTPTRHEDR